jgi:hypothetical protein
VLLTRAPSPPNLRDELLERAPLEDEPKRTWRSLRLTRDDHDADARIQGFQCGDLAGARHERIYAVEDHDARRMLGNGLDEVVRLSNDVNDETASREEESGDAAKTAVSTDEEYSNRAQGMHRVGRAVTVGRKQQVTLTGRGRADLGAKVGSGQSFRGGLVDLTAEDER